jgi:hypothetical protein
MPGKHDESVIMVERIARVIAEADGGDVGADHRRYRRMAVAALRPLLHPTESMIDAAHQAVWSDAFWAINSRQDFQKAVRAMIRSTISEAE